VNFAINLVDPASKPNGF